jgi:hypothetical protein
VSFAITSRCVYGAPLQLLIVCHFAAVYRLLRTQLMNAGVASMHADVSCVEGNVWHDLRQSNSVTSEFNAAFHTLAADDNTRYSKHTNASNESDFPVLAYKRCSMADVILFSASSYLRIHDL